MKVTVTVPPPPPPKTYHIELKEYEVDYLLGTEIVQGGFDSNDKPRYSSTFNDLQKELRRLKNS